LNKVKVEICQGTACHLLGAQELREALESLPEILREQIELCTVDCMKNCRQGPNVRIDGKVFSTISSEQLLALLKEKFGLTADEGVA